MTKPVLAFVMAFSLCTAMPARAEDQSIVLQAGEKLTRGLVNLTTGWLEVPKQIHHVGQEEGWLTGALRGPFDGIGMFAARTVAGAYEILTFLIPLPFRYQPLLQPEYVWQAEPPETHASQFEPVEPAADAPPDLLL